MFLRELGDVGALDGTLHLICCREAFHHARAHGLAPLHQLLHVRAHILQRKIRTSWSHQSRILPHGEIVLRAVARVGGGEIESHVAAIGGCAGLHTHFLPRCKRCHRFLPSLWAAILADVPHACEPPKRLLPGLDVLHPERAGPELGAQSVKHERGPRIRERFAQRVEVSGIQAVAVGSALQGIEILFDGQAARTGRDIGIDALLRHLRSTSRHRVARVEAANLRQRFIRPITRCCARRKMNSFPRKHRVTGNLLGRVEILGQQSRRHHQRRAGIRETLTGSTIDGKFLGRIERHHAREVAQRVGVFHVRQAPDHHRSRIARIRERDFV